MDLDILYNIFSCDSEIECYVDKKNINPTLVMRVKNSAKAKELEKIINCPPYAEQGIGRIVIINTTEE